jgi:GntR family transcriptional regulator
VANTPNYMLIAERLRKRIESGELKGGTQLPTELEMREEYGASRNTVRDAVKWLASRGLVEAYPGRGTFVTKRIVPFVITFSADPETGFGGGEGQAYVLEIEGQGRTPSVSAPQVGIEVAADAAPDLGLPAGAQVISRHQKRYIDGEPWSLQTSYYAVSLAERGATRLRDPSDVEQGVVGYLREILGIEQVGYVDRLGIRPVTSDEELFFELHAGSQRSVLENRRVAYDADGNPIRLTVSILHPDRTEIAIIEGQVPESARQERSWPIRHGRQPRPREGR